MNFRSWQFSSRAIISLLLLGVFSGVSAQVNLFDEFTRPDGGELGNNWLRKNPAAYQLSGGEVQKLPVSTGYRDNIVYRPAAEDALDVEASVILTFSSVGSAGYAQIFTRVQAGTVTSPDRLDGYILYVNNSSTTLILGRQRDRNFVSTLSTINLSSAFNTTDRYRLRLLSSGTNPVNLEAFIERENGSSWEIIGQAGYQDSSSSRITTAGSVGFGGYVEGNYRFDDFTRTILGGGAPANPLPSLSGISPDSAIEGDPAFELTVTGSNFVSDSVVRWNGSSRNTTFISGSELRAAVSAADIAAAGNASITVYSPAPGGGISSAAGFTIQPATIDNPVPVASQLSPSSVTEGEAGFTLTITGSGFVSDSVVRWNGVARPTTFVSGNTLQATIPASDVAVAGNVSVSVLSPAPGGGVSGALNFTIEEASQDNPLPTIAQLLPGSVAEGSGGFTLTITGSNFVDGAGVRWNGADRATTFISGSSLQASISGTDIASAGTALITVFNPAPGGGLSNALNFTIEESTPDNPAPVITQLTPASAEAGAGSFVLTVSGQDFVNGSVVRWAGSDRATSFISSNTLQTTISAADIAAAGTVSVSVFSPAPGGGLSATLSFEITEPVIDNPLPTLSNLLPSQVDAGGNTFTLLLSGANFVADAVVRINGSDRSTAYLSETQLEAVVTAGDIATPGTLAVSVFNPAPGGGGSGTLMLTIVDPNASTNPQPVLDRTEPVSAFAGSSDINLTAYGAAFTTDSVVRWNGTALTTTYIDAGTLQAMIPAALMTNNTLATITVATPAPGGGGTLPQSFFVLQAGEDLFYDNFNRPDNNAVGNNWVEKSPDDFSLLNGNVVSVESDGYHDSLVYRPASEAVLNMETGVEFTRLPDANRFPQLHARIGPDTVSQRGVLQSYLFFIDDFANDYNDGPQAMFAIQAPIYSEYECYIANVPMPAYIETGERYRLRFRVTGVDPVVLTGFVEQFNGASWDLLASGSTTHDASTQPDPDLYCDPDTMPAMIDEPGTVGLAKWIDPGDEYDNFYRIALIDDTTPPVISSLQPATALTGDPDFTLTVQGQFFTTESVIVWNGVPRATSFVSSSILTTVISSVDIQSVGSVPVSVATPSVGASGNLNFVIVDPAVNPVPVGNSLNPSSAYIGSPDFTLTVNGSGFTPESIVRWDGVNRVTSFVSDTALQITVPASDIILAGTAGITVFTPAPGGGTSATLAFTILEPVTADFFDDFNRTDSAAPGNDWIEKTPASFSLGSGSIQKLSVSTGYRDNIVYRPATEDTLDVESAVELRFVSGSRGYPQILARVQANTVATPNRLDGYMLYLPDSSTQFVLGRQTGTSFVSTLANINLASALNATDTYRLRLQVTGINPVNITAIIERLNGAAWQIIGQAFVQDFSAQRITTAGSVGFGGYIETGYRYDNFTRTLITGE